MTAISDGILASDTLNHRVPYRILLPAGYAESPKNFPVLYLLHGLFGSFENWTTLADVSEFAAVRITSMAAWMYCVIARCKSGSARFAGTAVRPSTNTNPSRGR